MTNNNYISESEWRIYVAQHGGITIKRDRHSIHAYDKNGRSVATYNEKDPRWDNCTVSSGITIESYAR